MTATTPIYALPYLEQGQPMYETRGVLEDLVERLETVLALGGAAAPGATDLLTLAGRVGTLETDQAAEDSARAAQVITFSAGYAQWTTAPYGELLRAWKPTPDLVRIVGMVQNTAAVAAGSASLPFATVPTGYRPAVVVNRTAFYQSVNPCRVTISNTTGVMSIIPAVAFAINQWFQLDLSYRLANT